MKYPHCEFEECIVDDSIEELGAKLDMAPEEVVDLIEDEYRPLWTLVRQEMILHMSDDTALSEYAVTEIYQDEFETFLSRVTARVGLTETSPPKRNLDPDTDRMFQ